jgi:hypothetical protein
MQLFGPRLDKETSDSMRPAPIAARDPTPSVVKGITQAVAELPLERDRLCLAGVGAAAVLPTTSDLDAERVLRLRVGLASDCRLASAETGAAGVAAWASDAVLRPRPSSLPAWHAAPNSRGRSEDDPPATSSASDIRFRSSHAAY